MAPNVELIRALYGAVGPKNVAATKNVVRAIAKDAPACRAHFEFGMRDLDRMAQISDRLGGLDANAYGNTGLMRLMRHYFPQSTAEGNRALYDVVLRRAGFKAGTRTLEVDGKIVDQAGKVVSGGKLATAATPGGVIKVNAESFSEASQTAFNIAVNPPVLDTSAQSVHYWRDFAKNLSVSEANGVTHMVRD